MGIAQPAIAIVPVSRTAWFFGQAGGERREDRPGVFITVEFQCQGRTDDFLLIDDRDRALFHPGSPVLGRLIEKFVTDFDEIIFNPDSPRQCEVHLRRQDDRCFLAEVRQRHVGEQPQVVSSHFIPKVAAAADRTDRRLVPTGDRLATDTNRR